MEQSANLKTNLRIFTQAYLDRRVRLYKGKLEKTVDEAFRKRLADIVLNTRGRSSQREFADRLGISQGALVGWERGTTAPNLENLAKLAELRGQFPEELLAELYGRNAEYSLEERINMLTEEQIVDLLVNLAARLQDKKSNSSKD